MRTLVYTRYALSALAVLALALAPAMAAVPAGFETITVSITDNGIMSSNDAPLGGAYVITVKNDTQAPRGIIMKGIDRGVSPYVRFSSVLDPGKSQSFRWFFPEDRTVRLRDLMCCTHAQRSCVVAGYGDMTETLKF